MLNFFRVSRRVRNAKGANSSEFALSLFVFFVVILFPLINVVGLAVSSATLCLLTHDIATRCSTQLTYSGALSAMTNECNELMNTGWAHFLNLQRTGGYSACGSDLYIQETGIGANSTKAYGPNTPLPMTPTPDKNIYEYVAKTTFTVKPLIPMSNVIFVKDIPALGQPVEIKWTAARATEFVPGLAKSTGSTLISGLTLPKLPPIATPPPTFLGPAPAVGGWRNPGIWACIPPPWTVLYEDVILVPANSITYVNTGLTVPVPGNAVLLDSHADGLWQGGPVGTSPDDSANGGQDAGPQLTTGALADGRVFGDWTWQTTTAPTTPPTPPPMSTVVPADPPNPNVMANYVGTPPPPAPPNPPSQPTHYNYVSPTPPPPGGTFTVGAPTDQSNWSELVGVVGSPPNITSPVIPGHVPYPAYPTATKGYFVLGCNSITKSPGSGLVQLVCNDNFRPDNLGSQVVRVFVLH